MTAREFHQKAFAVTINRLADALFSCGSQRFAASDRAGGAPEPLQRDGYRELHQACPACGSLKITQTLRGYLHAPDHNEVLCHDCSWRGTVDELIPALSAGGSGAVSPTTTCRHGRSECNRCGTSTRRDALHTTAGGRGLVARLRGEG